MLIEVLLVIAGISLGLALAPLLRAAPAWAPTVRFMGMFVGVLAVSAAVFAAQHTTVARIPPGLLQALNQVVPQAEITLLDVIKRDGTPATFVRQNLTVDTDTSGVSISMTGHDKPEQLTIDVTASIQKSALPGPLERAVPSITLRAGDASWVWDCKLVGGEVVCKKVQV